MYQETRHESESPMVNERINESSERQERRRKSYSNCHVYNVRKCGVCSLDSKRMAEACYQTLSMMKMHVWHPERCADDKHSVTQGGEQA